MLSITYIPLLSVVVFSLNMHTHELITFDQAQHSVYQMKERLSLLKYFDSFLARNNPERQIALILGEIQEVLVEIQKHPQKFQEHKFLDEINDVIVFFLAMILSRDITVDFTLASAGLNGFGKHSDAYDQLTEIFGNFNNSANEALEIARRLLSVIHHSPISMVHPSIQNFSKTIGKVDANRDAFLYSAFANSAAAPLLNQGRVLTEYEIYQKYHHLEKCLRFIRRNRKNPDVPLRHADWNWPEMVQNLLDFTNSEKAFCEVQRLHLARQAELKARHEITTRHPNITQSEAGILLFDNHVNVAKPSVLLPA